MTYHNSKARLLSSAVRLERKDAGGGDTIKETIDALARTFETFKEKNDGRINEVKKGFDDVVRKDELKRINTAMDVLEDLKKEFEAKSAAHEAEILALKRAPRGDGKGEKSPEAIEYKERFEKWFRKGESRDFTENDLRALEGKALSVGSDPDGGFTVLPEIDQAIDATIKLVSPMRQVATIRQIGTAAYKRFINIHGTTSGWVGEAEARTSTTTPQLKEVEIPVHEIYASPVATQSLLDDSFFNIESWLSEEVNLEFAYQEGVSFISGNGLKRPRGFLTETIAANSATETYGTIGYIATGASGAFASTAAGPPIVQGGDVFHDVVQALKSGYRANAQWLANRRTVAKVRQLKDLYANYIWQPGLQAGQPSSLVGYPVVDMEDMPDIASNSYSIAFGDWKRAYTIVDRIGTRVLRDPYTSKPNVIFYTTKRVGGKTTMHEAIKLLKFAAS